MPLGPMRTKAQKREGMHTVMHEFKHGALHSGSKTGPVVKNRKQAIAIALSQTGQSKYPIGGRTEPLPIEFQGYASGGGLKALNLRAPALQGLNGFRHLQDGGFIDSDVPGRTDKHYIRVDSGSYVLPADHVSALGQNNSNAG